MKRSARALGVTMLMLVAGALSIALAPRAAAQPATIKAGSGDDLRPAYANAAEIADGKRVAEASCASCHGANGVSATKGVPHLAGQRPAYLYLELRAYQSGARGDNAMGAAVKFLNDDALVKVAAYYASLDPALAERAQRRKACTSQAGRGPGRQGGGGSLRRVPRGHRHQQDTGHAEPGRAGPQVSGRGDEGLQERPAQARRS